MFLKTQSINSLSCLFDKIGLSNHIKRGCEVAIKINLAKYPESNVPRTDSQLLLYTIQYIYELGASPVVVEGADGHLGENLSFIGLENFLKQGLFKFIDLDTEIADEVIAQDGEVHYIPRCLKEFPVRIAIPVTSLRDGHEFSNNIKLFTGLVPRRFYQKGISKAARPQIHENLHRSISNIYKIVNRCIPFLFYINGGNTYIRTRKHLCNLPEYYVGDNGLDLDMHIIDSLGIEMPEYIFRYIYNSTLP